MMKHLGRFTKLAAAVLLACGTASATPATAVVEVDGDWRVNGEESRRGEHIRLNGNLVLPAGSRLTLEDCSLEILGRHSREHVVDWQGGTLVTRNCTLGGFVNENGVAIHTVFHLYDGNWEAVDTVVQYSYGISFHWARGHGVLRGTRLKAGPRPDAIILSGEADVRLIDCQFPIGLGLYVDQGGSTTLDLSANEPVTAKYDAANLLPAVKWRLQLQNTIVDRWFVFVRNMGGYHPPAEITLRRTRNPIVSLLGHNLQGRVTLTNDLAKPLQLGNVTLKRAEEPVNIAMWALYFSGDETDVSVNGRSHICELMHRGGQLQIAGSRGSDDLSVGCTTLELSGNAQMQLQNVHLGRPLAWKSEASLGEANVAGTARLTGDNLSVRNVRFRTRDDGQVTLTNVRQHGTVEQQIDGGGVQIEVIQARS
jgi:hypothetical protein